MTHEELLRIIQVLAQHIPNSGSVGDLRHLADWMRNRPDDFVSAINAINKCECYIDSDFGHLISCFCSVHQTKEEKRRVEETKAKAAACADASANEGYPEQEEKDQQAL